MLQPSRGHLRGRSAAKEPTDMNTLPKGRSVGRSLLLAGRLAGAAAIASPAAAGECPAGAMKPNAREAVTFQPVGVTDTVLAQIDLAKEPIKADGRLQRVRRLVIQPGGIVPSHSYDARTAPVDTD